MLVQVKMLNVLKKYINRTVTDLLLFHTINWNIIDKCLIINEPLTNAEENVENPQNGIVSEEQNDIQRLCEHAHRGKVCLVWCWKINKKPHQWTKNQVHYGFLPPKVLCFYPRFTSGKHRMWNFVVCTMNIYTYAVFCF